ncbi:MAG: hypothetical protein ACSLEN_13510 [Candidatus Malihini olakiniferum]
MKHVVKNELDTVVSQSVLAKQAHPMENNVLRELTVFTISYQTGPIPALMFYFLN